MPHTLHRWCLLVLLAGCGRTPPADVAPTPAPPPAAEAEPGEPVVDSTLEQGDRSLRLAVNDVMRLGVATSIREPRPGLLRLELGPGFRTASAEYNLRSLFSAYLRHHPLLDDPPVFELLREGTQVGTYGDEGLLLEPGAEDDLAAAPETPPPAAPAVPVQRAPGLDGQLGRRGRYYLSFGGGAGVADFTCPNCEFEMSTAPSGFLAAGLRVSEGLVLALEGTGWTKTDDRGRGTIYSAMATGVGYILDNRPVFLSLGVGYLGFKRPVAEGTYRADALGFTTRLGADFGIGGSWALSPYVGVLGSFGSPQFELDGSPSIIEAAIRNLQFGVALTVR